VQRYEAWKKLREKAARNANGHLPPGFREDEPTPPPSPKPIDDKDIADLSMELNAASIDGEMPHDLDESGLDRVPMADPGIDVSGRFVLHWGPKGLIHLCPIPLSCQRSYPEINTEMSPTSPHGPHMRRKSVLPGKSPAPSVKTMLTICQSTLRSFGTSRRTAAWRTSWASTAGHDRRGRNTAATAATFSMPAVVVLEYRLV
jgi:hypothetical protein